MSTHIIHLAKNHGGPLHYLGNRFLTLPDISGHMLADNSWLNEHFTVLMANHQGKKYQRAFEPFAGSASWSLAAMELGVAEEYIINDSNKVLINTLRLIKEQPRLIKDSYCSLLQKYHQSASREQFFRETIEQYNAANQEEEKSLLLPFIINHSWSGIIFYDDKLNIIYRDTSQSPLEKANLSLDNFCDEVDRVSALFNANRVKFNSGDFMQIVSEAKAGDFVALNPPYPENDRSIVEKTGMYVELYSPEKLHENLVAFIESMEEMGVHYYMTYGFYNPAMKRFVLSDEQNRPKNYFRILSYDDCAFGVGLDQMYFSSHFTIPKLLDAKIIPAVDVLENNDITAKEAFERFNRI